MDRHACRYHACRSWLVRLLVLSLLLMTAAVVPDAAHTPTPIPASYTTPSSNHFYGYSPAQIRRAYGVDRLSANGAGQVIAIVTAYDSASLGGDLQFFDRTFGVPSMYGDGARPCTIAHGPHPCLERRYPAGRPGYEDDWAIETALCVEWAHAIAPGSDILLVEVRQSSFADLLSGVDLAAGLASVVAMSWGSAEFDGETELDKHFQKPGVTFLAATGDVGAGPLYPAASPYVVAVGGTTLQLKQDGARTSETSWIGSGSGPSRFESEPAYQRGRGAGANDGRRMTPDVVYSADPFYGYPVYNSRSPYGQNGWFRMGGTSAAVPQWAALFALANQLRDGPRLASTNLASSPLYRIARSRSAGLALRPIPTGNNAGPSAGLGAPRAEYLVPALAR